MRTSCKDRSAFTLIELMVAITIVAIIGAIAVPELQKGVSRAQSVTCANNLRQIGVGILTYTGENDNTFPVIEPSISNPVYGPDWDGPTPTPITELEPYGITEQVLKCPTDVKIKSEGTTSYFERDGTSYQWRVIVDGENGVTPKIYGGRRGGYRFAKPSRVTICTDQRNIHFGRYNKLYADGHIAPIKLTE